MRNSRRATCGSTRASFSSASRGNSWSGPGGYFVNLGIFSALYGTGTPYLPASIVSYFIANTVMYVGNRYFTFRLGNAGFWATYLRYLLTGALVGGLNVGILAALVEGTG